MRTDGATAGPLRGTMSTNANPPMISFSSVALLAPRDGSNQGATQKMLSRMPFAQESPSHGIPLQLTEVARWIG